jgi:hypothetical protein
VTNASPKPPRRGSGESQAASAHSDGSSNPGGGGRALARAHPLAARGPCELSQLAIGLLRERDDSGGANLYHVKDLLGHETLDTLRHYAKLNVDDLRGVMAV